MLLFSGRAEHFLPTVLGQWFHRYSQLDWELGILALTPTLGYKGTDVLAC